jgi:hypothetical protein
MTQSNLFQFHFITENCVIDIEILYGNVITATHARHRVSVDNLFAVLISRVLIE